MINTKLKMDLKEKSGMYVFNYFHFSKLEAQDTFIIEKKNSAHS